MILGKFKKQLTEPHSGRRGSNICRLSSNGCIGKGSSFFRKKPRLAILYLKRKYFRVRIQFDAEKREVEGYLWFLEIENKSPLISEDVAKCQASIFFDDVGEYHLMKWLPLNATLPEIVGLSARQGEKQSIENLFGFDYPSQLMAIGEEVVDIPKEKSRELFFLMTFKESNYAFMILDQNGVGEMWMNKIHVHGIDEKPLLLRLTDEHSFRIKLGTEMSGKEYHMITESYDRITISGIKSYP